VGEIYTTSPTDHARDRWLQRTISNSGRALSEQRERLFDLAGVQRHHLVLDINAGSGLLTWEAVRRAPEGGVWALATNSQAGEALRQQAAQLPEIERPAVLIGPPGELADLLVLRDEGDVRFDHILSRNPHNVDLFAAELLRLLAELLLADGRFSLVQTIPRHGQRLYRLVDWQGDGALGQKVAAAEEGIYSEATDPLVNWDEKDLVTWLETIFIVESDQLVIESGQQRIAAAQLARWLAPAVDGERPSYRQRLKTAGLTAAECDRVATIYQRQLQEQVVAWETTVFYARARLGNRQ
jgi:putative ATPase